MNALGHGSLGISARIRKFYPNMFDEYHKLCGWFKDYKLQEEIIGMFQGLPFPDSSNILCNAFGQRFLSDTKYVIDFDAWEKICRKMISQIQANNKSTGILYEIHCPYKIGHGMKPEEVDRVKEIIEEYFADSDIKFVYHI